MKFIDIERKMKYIRSLPGSDMNMMHKVVLSVYMDNYNQKQEFLVDDYLNYISPEDALTYGIRLLNCKYRNSSYIRAYILFIDKPECMINEEEFNCFAGKYCERFLPNGAEPSLFAFIFDINSYTDYMNYIKIITKKYPHIQPFYTFSKLIKEQNSYEKLKDKIQFFGNDFNVVAFDLDSYKRVTQSLESIDNTPFLFLKDIKRNLDDFAHSLPDNVLLISGYIPENPDSYSIYAVSLAYLNYTYQVPILAEGTMHDMIMAYMKKFYCSYLIYTAADKIRFFQKYPIITYMSRSLAEFLVYIYPNDRKLYADIQYLENGIIKSDEIDLYACEVRDIDDKNDFYTNLVNLEEALGNNSFLHIGNCLFIMFSGKTRFVFLNRINADFKSILYSCDSIIKPFERRLFTNDLIDALPWTALSFHKGVKKFSLKEAFLQFLLKLEKEGKISSLSFQTGVHMYIPPYAKDGTGVLLNVFTEINRELSQFNGVDEQLLQLFSSFNVNMRNVGIDSITDIIPLYKLRHQSDYLTLYGAKNVLVLNEKLFKS